MMKPTTFLILTKANLVVIFAMLLIIPQAVECSKGVKNSNKANKSHSNVLGIRSNHPASNGTITKGANATGKTVGKTTFNVEKQQQKKRKKSARKAAASKTTKTATAGGKKQQQQQDVVADTAAVGKKKNLAATGVGVVHGNNHNNKDNLNNHNNKDNLSKKNNFGNKDGLGNKDDLGNKKNNNEGEEEESLELRRQKCQQLCGVGKENGGVKERSRRRAKRMGGWCPECEENNGDEEVNFCTDCQKYLVEDLCAIATAETLEQDKRRCTDCETEDGCEHMNGLYRERQGDLRRCVWDNSDGGSCDWDADEPPVVEEEPPADEMPPQEYYANQSSSQGSNDGGGSSAGSSTPPTTPPGSDDDDDGDNNSGGSPPPEIWYHYNGGSGNYYGN